MSLHDDLNEIRKCAGLPIAEQVDVENVKVLFHASHIGNLESIEEWGIIPMHGEIVQGTETHQQYEEWEEELEELAFFSPESPGFVNWQVGNHIGKDMWDVTVDDIRRYGLMAVLIPANHADEIYCADGKGGAHSLDGSDRLYEIPAHVEGVDCFSFHPVQPDAIYTGNNLISFLQKYFPSVLVQASGKRDAYFKTRGKDPGYVPREQDHDQNEMVFHDLPR